MGRWSEGAGPMSQTQGEVGRDGWTEREREREKEGGREGGRKGGRKGGWGRAREGGRDRK